MKGRVMVTLWSTVIAVYAVGMGLGVTGAIIGFFGGLLILGQVLLRFHRRETRREEARRLASEADEQHAAWLRGDDRLSIFGRYQLDDEFPTTDLARAALQSNDIGQYITDSYRRHLAPEQQPDRGSPAWVQMVINTRLSQLSLGHRASHTELSELLSALHSECQTSEQRAKMTEAVRSIDRVQQATKTWSPRLGVEKA